MKYNAYIGNIRDLTRPDNQAHDHNAGHVEQLSSTILQGL